MNMDLRLYNTLTGKVEPLVPEIPPTVRMYACGLTVYNRGHIGNFRTFLATDLLRRTLRYKGYGVKEVMNITDVDDKIIQQAQAAGRDLASFTAEWTATFLEDMATLKMERPEVVPRGPNTTRRWTTPAGRSRPQATPTPPAAPASSGT